MAFTDKKIYGKFVSVWIHSTWAAGDAVPAHDDADWLEVGATGSANLDRNTEVIEVTPDLGSGTAGDWAANDPGKRSWSAGIEQIVNYGSDKFGFEEFIAKWQTGTKVALMFKYTEGTNIVSEAGACVIESIGENFAGASEHVADSVSLTGDGALTFSKVEA